MLNVLQYPLRRGFSWLEALFDKPYGPPWNPLRQLGTLSFFFFWVAAVTGIYVFILFDTSVTGAYPSVEYMTNEQVVSWRRHAEPAPLFIGRHGDYHGVAPAPRIRTGPLSGPALIFLVHRRAGDLAAFPVGDQRLLAGLGSARPIRRHRLHGMARLARHFR